MLEWIAKINDQVNTFVWVTIGIWLLLGAGLLMSVLTKFFQFGHIGHWMKNTVGALFSRGSGVHRNADKKNISQFQSLCTALSATVGTGNIAGVATAIVSGGPGAVFWMWVAAILGMMTNYSENVLGIFYRRKNAEGEWCGGAMYYLRDGLGAKKHCKGIGMVLAVLFAVFCVLASFGIGNLSQANAIAANMNAAFHIPTWAIGIGLMLLGALVIVGGIKRVASVTEKIVPFMVVLYMIGTVSVFCVHIDQAGAVFSSIFGNAFGVRAVAGGFQGILVKEVITWGCKRGVFSNEAGLGSSVMVHSCSNVKEPVRQGMWGIFEVFADTIVVCTLTAFTILSSGLVDLSTGQMLDSSAEGGTTLVSAAFSDTFGSVGSIFVAVAILLFAFSTILGWSVYGSKAWEYLFGTKSTKIFKVIFTLVICVGPVLTSSLAWDISDTFNGMMMIPNLIGVVALSPVVARITKNYVDRHIKGKNVEPMLSNWDDVQEEAAEAVKLGAE